MAQNLTNCICFDAYVHVPVLLFLVTAHSEVCKPTLCQGSGVYARLRAKRLHGRSPCNRGRPTEWCEASTRSWARGSIRCTGGTNCGPLGSDSCFFFSKLSFLTFIRIFMTLSQLFSIRGWYGKVCIVYHFRHGTLGDVNCT